MLVNANAYFTARKCRVVMFSVASVCARVCVCVCLSVCNALTYERFDLESVGKVHLQRI